MTNNYILSLDDKNANLEWVGGKGASLARLIRAGLPVPNGFQITTKAYRKFVDENALQSGILAALDPVDFSSPQTLEVASQAIHKLFMGGEIPSSLAEDIAAAYAQLHRDSPAVAVRSSATAEDLPEASFAGQQETFLNIRGTDALLAATKKCWASLWTARAIGYRARQEIDFEGVALAVVVQLLVPADVAGIMFTANPLNGKRDETVINAAWGLGESIVGGQVTPDIFTIGKSSGAMISREVAPKLIQTARTNFGVEQQPVPEHLQNTPALSDEQATELATLGTRIEEIYGMPMDIEWTLTEGEFAIVQARPVTALPEPPIEWAPPKPKGVYMRASVVDLMPVPLSPLYITLGIPTKREQMKPLGERLTGGEPILAEDYFTSINTYAYMNHSIPSNSWRWILFHLLPTYPKMLKELVPIWRDELLPEYKAIVGDYAGKAPNEMSVKELWGDAQELVRAVMYYICGLMFATMGASAGSEGLLTRVYDKFAKGEGDPDASVLMMGWDNIPVRSQKSLFDLAMWAKEQDELADFLLETPTEELSELTFPHLRGGQGAVRGWDDFASRFQAHLEQYGHMVYQLDFAEPLPRDHPEPMLETIKMYLRSEGSNPHERQRDSEALRIQTTEKMLNRLKGFKLWAFTKALNWGQSMAEVREDALAEIGLGYPILRAMLLELGKRLTDAGAIQEPDDIFWLEKVEIDDGVANLESSKSVEDMDGRVVERKAFWKRAKASTPPPIMPEKKRVMGFKTEAFVPHAAGTQSENSISGVATSLGVVTAPACVLHGPEDFGKMQPGDVLVAGTTTPAWTPLFAMASAVVTDVGGPLSHGSIVAREYGIPAVMGTGIATKRIQDGQMITVDGSEGTVEINRNTQ